MKKLLITGATGFLGRNLMQRIDRRQYEVYALGRTRPESVDEGHFHACDWMKPDMQEVSGFLEEIRADALMMLAWDVGTQSYWESFANHRWADVSIQLAEAFLSTGGGINGFYFLAPRPAMIISWDGLRRSLRMNGLPLYMALRNCMLLR